MKGTHFSGGVYAGGDAGAEKGGIDETGKVYAIAANTATTVGAAGAASALPATPSGYLTINIAGTNYKVPYYTA